MRALFALLLVLALTGATCQRRDTAPVADAPAECYRAHFPSATDTGVRWECADPESPACWDDLGESVLPELARRGLGTEASRQACVDFIRALQRRGVVRAKP